MLDWIWVQAGVSRRFSRVIATSEQRLRWAFDKLGGDVRVHMEAGELASWVHSVIKPMVSEVIVSHPRSLAWIGKDSVKDDKVDAGKLAELLRLGRVHEVYCEEDTRRRTFKHLVTHHEQMSREQARQKLIDRCQPNRCMLGTGGAWSLNSKSWAVCFSDQTDKSRPMDRPPPLTFQSRLPDTTIGRQEHLVSLK